jgi:tetratricopeptide (TPR) repeat protein
MPVPAWRAKGLNSRLPDLTSDVAEKTPGPWRGAVALLSGSSSADRSRQLISCRSAGTASACSGHRTFSAEVATIPLRIGRSLRTRRNRPGNCSFCEVLRRKPGDGDALVKLTGSLVATGDLAHAAEMISACPRNVECLMNLANVFIRENRPQDAAATSEEARAADPERLKAWNLAGLASLQTGPPRRAECFPGGDSNRDGFRQCAYNPGALLAGRRDFGGAEREFAMALEIDPSQIEACRNYSLFLTAQQKPQSCNRCFAEVRRQCPAIRICPRRCCGSARGNRRFRMGGTQVSGGARERFIAGRSASRSRNAADLRAHLQIAAAKGDADIRKAALNALPN